MNVCIIAVGLVPKGGTGLSSMDGVLILEELAYGCTGVTSPIVANDLAVSNVCITCMCLYARELKTGVIVAKRVTLKVRLK